MRLFCDGHNPSRSSISKNQLDSLSGAGKCCSLSARLEIFTFDVLPYPWAVARKNLGDAFRQYSAVSEEPDRTRLAKDAADEYRQALRVLNAEETPFDYQATHKALAVIDATIQTKS